MKLFSLLTLLFSFSVPSAQAQTAAPSAEQMIEQLKVPRTRGLRNFSVEAVPSKAATEIIMAPGAAAQSSIQATQSVTSEPSPTVVQAEVFVRPSLSLMIQFDFNSARVRPESQQALANLAQALQSTELLSSRFAVEGHTDAKGSSDFNQKLSLQRALAVSDFMSLRGVGQDRLVAQGKGSTELSNKIDPFAAENRRVRIVNLD